MARSTNRARKPGPQIELEAERDTVHCQGVSRMQANRLPAFFIADAPGLDFLNSIATPVDEVVEWIGCGEDLLEWLRQAGLVPRDVLDSVRESALPGELDTVAAQARALREWFRAFVHKHKGKPLRPSVLPELEPLNALLARDEVYGRIVARPPDHAKKARSALGWQAQRRWRSPESLLLPIAKALAELICEEDFTRIKGCEGSACVLLFMDRTNSGARRWCSMAICGNRAKQSALRARQRRSRRE